jgi:hypothetical protein
MDLSINKCMSDIREKEIEQFITDGFVRIDNAVSSKISNAVLDILWKDIPFERSNPKNWPEPVVRLGMYSQKSFIDSVNTPNLHSGFNQLIGSDKWLPCQSVGTFPIRD